MNRIVHRLLAPALVACVAAPAAGQTDEDLEIGRRIFDAQCARCHGIGGTGGEGPTLHGRRFRTVSEPEDIVTVIENGIGGMPSFWMGEAEARRVADYVWSVARVEPEPVPGDPDAGRAVFEGKGACTTCHIVEGKGRGLGPELTDVGARRAPAFLRRAIVTPGADLPPGQLGPHASFLMIRATRGDGREVEGMRVWEDAFVVHLRDEEGAYHSLRKSELRDFQRRFGASLMPEYGETLSDDEVTDLVAYLASLRGRR